MKCFHPLLILLLFLLFINPPCRAQFKDRPSEIKTKITVPIFTDRTEKIHQTNPKFKDIENTYVDKRIDIYIDLPDVPLDAGSIRFDGKYTADLMPFGTYSISGTINNDRSMVQTLIITKNVEYNKDGYQETEKWKATIKDLPLNGGIGRFTKGKTSVSIDEYEFKSVSNTGRSVDYNEYTFKSMDKEKTFDAWNFSVYLNIDGPTSYSIMVEDVRGPDPAWQPPAALVNPDKFTTNIEPNSISFYANYEGLDEESKMWTKYFYQSSMFRLLNVPGLKVLERGELKHILREVDLSQSGLVKEESKVNSGGMMKEQVAVITKMDLQKNTLECDIQSRKGEKKIIVLKITMQNRSFAFNELSKKAHQVINNFTTKPLIPAGF